MQSSVWLNKPPCTLLDQFISKHKRADENQSFALIPIQYYNSKTSNESYSWENQDLKKLLKAMEQDINGLYSLRNMKVLDRKLRRLGSSLSLLSFWTQSWKWAGVCWRQQETRAQTRSHTGQRTNYRKSAQWKILKTGDRQRERKLRKEADRLKLNTSAWEAAFVVC